MDSAHTVFPPAPPTHLPIIGSTALFPVRRVYCVGQNYTEHILEMGADIRQPPFFFSKPADALVAVGSGCRVAYPPLTENLHHEIELVVALKQGGANIPVSAALACVFGYAVGLDMTRRDLQASAKKTGKPWDMAKGFDHSAPLSAILPIEQLRQAEHSAFLQNAQIWLKVNGEMRQNGNLAQMLWSVAEIISNLSSYVRLAPGDLIFTGTPAGVSSVLRGDRLHGGIDQIGELNIWLV